MWLGGKLVGLLTGDAMGTKWRDRLRQRTELNDFCLRVYRFRSWTKKCRKAKRRQQHRTFKPPVSWPIFTARCYTVRGYVTVCRPSVRTSVCPSVTRVNHSKMVEVRIMQLSPQSSPIWVTLVSSRLTSPRNSKGNVGSGAPNEREVGKNTQFLANIHLHTPYW